MRACRRHSIGACQRCPMTGRDRKLSTRTKVVWTNCRGEVIRRP